MRTWIITLGLCLFFFVIPIQFFVIGQDYGWGIQGAVYRYQVTSVGNSLIPIPYEIGYVTSGIYSGFSALSVILWASGSLFLGGITLFSVIRWNNLSRSGIRIILLGLIGVLIFYCSSCIARYGPFFTGPAGLSIPIGLILLSMIVLFLHFYYDLFSVSEELVR